MSQRGNTAGWYPESKYMFRWWTGRRWGDARSTQNGGLISVRDRIGQAVITIPGLGRSDAGVVEALMSELQAWPPVEIVSLNTYASAVAAGTNLIAVVRWLSPDAYAHSLLISSGVEVAS